MSKMIPLTLFVTLFWVGMTAQQTVPNRQLPPAARHDQAAKPPKQTQPAVGKAGQHGTEINTTTTATTGTETPGVQTTPGIAQQPGTHTASEKKPAPLEPKRRPGSPPNWEQAGQHPEQADRDAATAALAEMGGPQGTLGVNGAQPSATTQQNQTTRAAQKKGPTRGAANANSGGKRPGTTPPR